MDPSQPKPDERDVVTFVLHVAGAMHGTGMPSHRLESLLEAVVERLGIPSQFFAMPTATIAAFGTPPKQRTYLVTPRMGDVDLGRLQDLDALVQDVAEGRVDAKTGSTRVRAILDSPPAYPLPGRLAAHAVAAASAALLLAGGWREAVVASVAGLAIGSIDAVASKPSARATSERRPLAQLLPAIGAALSAALGALGALIWPALSIGTVGVAGVIMLVPGFTLTVAMNEIATGHLVSGTARLSKAMMTFLLLGFGGALGDRLATALPLDAVASIPPSTPLWVPWIAALAFVPCLMVLLGARARDVAYILPACAIAFTTGFFGAALFGPVFGAGLATLVLGLVANAFARWRDRPAVLLLVPGTLLLVPGSLGFRSISAFVDNQVLAAITTAFDVALIAVALVAGLLVAAVALPPRRAL